MTFPLRVPTRRAFLRGAGATLFLPWFGSLAPRRAGGPAFDPRPPVRLAVLFMPNGVHAPAWTPAGEGPLGALSPILEPLEAFKEDLLVVSGLRNANSAWGDGHYAKVAPLLTGARIRKTGGRDLLNGVSMDQLVAQASGGRTPLPSIELSTEPVRTMEDMGFSTVYGAHISWRTPSQPAAREIVPRLAFDRLFRSTRLREERSGRSVLDVVREDARRLRARLGSDDREKLDEYSESVRALEKRIDAAARDSGGRPAPGPADAPPEGIPADFPTHVRLMLDLVALAFRCDATRVATFMFGNEVSGRDFSFLDGVRGTFHDFSHHENRPEKKAAYQAINRWHVERLADLLRALRAAPEGGSTLLDHCQVVFAAAMRDGNSHDPDDLPVLVAGRGGGALATGRHLAAPRRTPLCNLWLSLLRNHGVAVDTFGDSTGALL